MNKKSLEAFNEMAKAMDKRDIFLFKLKDYVQKHGNIPDEYQEDYEAFRKDKFHSWRSMPKVVKKVVKAAKKASHAPVLEKLTEQSKDTSMTEIMSKILEDKNGES